MFNTNRTNFLNMFMQSAVLALLMSLGGYMLAFILALILPASAQSVIEVCVHKSVPTRFHSGIEAGAEHWKKRLKYVGRCDGTPNQVPVLWLNDWDDKQTILAYTNTDFAGRVSVHVNGTKKWSHLPLGQKDHYHFATIMAHEFGHVLGFSHVKSGIMKPNFSLGEAIIYNFPAAKGK
jgi:Matrixin